MLLHLKDFILQLLIELSDFYVEQVEGGYFSRQVLLTFMLQLMLTGLAVLIPVGPLRNGLCFFETLSFHGNVRKNPWSRSLLQKQSIAMSSACSEIIWLRCLLIELGHSWLDPTPLYVDNISVIRITSNPDYHEPIKHIEVDCHFFIKCFKMVDSSSVCCF